MSPFAPSELRVIILFAPACYPKPWRRVKGHSGLEPFDKLRAGLLALLRPFLPLIMNAVNNKVL